jgi:SAM-dependent methyltransferase
MDDLIFGVEQAAQYEAWFDTEEGRLADRLEKALLLKLLVGFGEPGTLLEVGCGTGHFARWFKELGWKVAGLDVSFPMLAEARRRDRDMALALAEGTALPLAGSSWDVVALITVLEFVRDPAVALREALRVARRGVLLGVLNRWSWLAAQRRIQGWFGPTPYDRARFLSASDLRRMIGQANLAAAGGLGSGRSEQFEVRTTLWPRWWFVSESPLPWGGFLGMKVTWGQQED